MFTYELHPSAFGVGFTVYEDNQAVFKADYQPGAPGFVGMTEAEAVAEAEAEIASREAPAEAPAA